MKLHIPKWVTERLLSRAARSPYDHLPGYMNRYWLVPLADPVHGRGCGPVSWWRRPVAWTLQQFGIAVRIHEILRSDDDRALHDHPWPYLTVILSGGYYEHTVDAFGELSTWHGPGDVLYRSADFRHRLELFRPFWFGVGAHDARARIPAVTLFITGRWQQSWGFFPGTGETKVSPKVYLSERGHP